MININSTKDLQLVFFGGSKKVIEKQPILDDLGNPILYKSGDKKGQVKYKNKEISKLIKPLDKIEIYQNWYTEKGNISVNESTLKEIAKLQNDSGKLAVKILKIRGIEKQLSTYYNGIQNKIYDIDSCVHPNFNHVSTDTGRLSCNNPNIQNQPNKNDSLVLQHFMSRWKDGLLLNADFKQLEVVVVAWLCNDENMKKVLNQGKDIHLYVASYLYNKKESEITDLERKKIKPCTFLVIYGGGAKRLSQTLGLDLEFCENFIKTFYSLFPRMKEWHKEILDEVEQTSTLHNFTGRILKFTKFPAKFQWQLNKGIKESYNPSDIKDWPVQSLATGDLVLIALGNLWRKLVIHRDKCLLINTVHDSIMIDVKEEHLEFIKQIVKKELENIKDIVYNNWNINIDVPILVDIKTGKTWYEV